MKRTPYTVKAQRARKAWKRLKEQTQTKATISQATTQQLKSSMEYELPEMAHDA